MSILKKVIVGAIGGVVGAVLMDEANKAASKLIHLSPPKGEDATEKVANSVAKKVTGQKLRSSTKKSGGQIVHYGFAASMGILYVLLADNVPLVGAARGALFGAALYAGAHALAVPALGLADSPMENGAARESAELSSHVVYGMATDTVRRIFVH